MDTERNVDPGRRTEDWEGNNIAVTCPVCSKVYLVSGAPQMHSGRRKCPSCQQSEGVVDGGRKTGGGASLRTLLEIPVGGLIPEIKLKEKPFGETITGVTGLLESITRWHDDKGIEGADAHRRVWFRGHGDCGYRLVPGVYRDEFTEVAEKQSHGSNLEDKRLNLEREMLSEFRVSGATLLNPDSVVSVYFSAQHFGMPTRLLDWTTNPLAALLFAVRDSDSTDGDLILMDAAKLEPHRPRVGTVITMRHPYAVDAIGVSFWHEQKELREPRVLAVRPDAEIARIALQSSCFTMHMHHAVPSGNTTIERIRIAKSAKGKILAELRRLNVNEFTVYADLDHLSREICVSRGIVAFGAARSKQVAKR